MFEIETDREKRGIEEIQRQTEKCRERERVESLRQRENSCNLYVFLFSSI